MFMRHWTWNSLTLVAAVQQRLREHVGVTHRSDLRLDRWKLWSPDLSIAFLLFAQRVNVYLLQLLTFQWQGLHTLGVVAQVTIARHLQHPDQAVQWAVAAPGVVIETEVGKARQREQDVLRGCCQAVVLKEQSGELGKASEGSLLHHGDLILLEVQALQLGELGEHVVPQNLKNEIWTVDFCAYIVIMFFSLFQYYQPTTLHWYVANLTYYSTVIKFSTNTNGPCLCVAEVHCKTH